MLEAGSIIESAYIYVKAITPRMLVNLAFSQPYAPIDRRKKGCTVGLSLFKSIARISPKTVPLISRSSSDSELISLFVQVILVRKVGRGCHAARITHISDLRSVAGSDHLTELASVFVFI